MADQRVNGNLVLIGTSGGTIALGCQPSGGGFTILLPTTIPQIGQTLVISSVFNGNTATAQWGIPASGTVTSIGFTAPAIFTVSGQPITTSGVVALGLATQGANTFFAGPTSGSAATPTFRPITIADIPATGTPSSSTFLRGDGTWSVVPIITTFVTSFNGRSGVVTAQSGDYSYAQITGTPQLPVTPVVPSSNWLNGYTSTSGVFSYSQPASTDLSDSASLARLASPTFTGTVTLPAVSVTGALTFTTANPTFFSSTGSGQVVLATSPTITAATLAGTTTATNLHIMGTLADGSNSVGTSGQVLTSTVTGVQWSTASTSPITFTPVAHNFLTGYNSGTHTFSAAQPAASDLSNGVTGSGAVVLAVGPSLTGTTSLVNISLTGTFADDTSSVGTSGQVLTSTGTGTLWFTPTVAFNNVTSGSNTTATMTVGSGGTLTFSGTGVVNANEIFGVVISNTAPSAGQVLTATSSSAAQWSTPTASGAVNNGTGGQLTWYATTGTAVSGNPNATISSGTVTLGQVGSVQGELTLSGTGAGSSVNVTVDSSIFTPWTLTLPVDSGTTGYVLETDGTGKTSWVAQGGGGGGSVTAFSSGDFSPLFTTSVSNPTTTPALSFTTVNQAANVIYAGPTSGGSAAPTFRALVDADLPGGFTGTGAVVLADAPTFTTNPIFASSTGSGAVVLAVGPSLTGTTTVANEHITGTLADNTNSTGTSGQVLTAGTGGQVVWGTSGGGTIGGSIAAGQVAVGSGTNTIAGSSTVGAALLDTSSAGIVATEAGTGGITLASTSLTAPTTVQQFSFLSTSVSSYDVVFPSDTVAGNQLVLFVGLDQTATHPSSISDTQGNVWTQQVFFIGGGDTHGFTLFTSKANSSAPLTVSLTFSISTNVAVLAAEVQDSPAFEQILHNSGSSISWSSQTLRTRADNELLLAFDVAYHPPANLTDGFTQLQSQTLPFGTNVQMDMASENAPTVGAYTSSWTMMSSGEWHTIIMSYLPATTGNVALTASSVKTTATVSIDLANSGTAGTNITDIGGGGINITDMATTGPGIELTSSGELALTCAVEMDLLDTGNGIFITANSNTTTPNLDITCGQAGGSPSSSPFMDLLVQGTNGSLSLENVAGPSGGGIYLHDTSGGGIFGQVTNSGGFTVISSGTTAYVSFQNQGSGGTGISDSGTGGVAIRSGVGGQPGASLILENDGSAGTELIDTGSGGIAIINNGPVTTPAIPGAHAIGIWQQAATGLGILIENDSAGTNPGDTGIEIINTASQTGSTGIYVWNAAATGSGTLIQDDSPGGTQIDVTSSGVQLLLNPSGQSVRIGKKLNANSTDFAGVASVSASTSVTVNFSSNFTGTNAPFVVLTPQIDPTTTGTYWVTINGSTGAWTGFTVHVSISGTIAFNYIVIGNES
jgi:hypothetical protein